MQKFWPLVFFLLSASSFAETLIFKAAFVLDMEKGEWISPGLFVVKNQKIVALNPATPDKGQVIDLGKTYIIPGLIDSHTHLFLDDPTLGKDFARGLLSFLQKTPPEMRMRLGRARMKDLIHNGFTSVRDLGNSGELHPEKLELTIGPRVFSSGKGYAPKYGQLPAGTDQRLLRSEYADLNLDPEDALSHHAFSLVKIYADEDPLPTVTALPVLKKWVQVAHKKNFKVAVHAILTKAIQSAIESGADSIEHGYFATRSQLIEMKKKGIIFVPTNGNSLLLKLPMALRSPGVEEEEKRVCGLIGEASVIGVSLAFGSDFYFTLSRTGLSFGEATKEALLKLAHCGLTPFQMIHAATVGGARVLGGEKQLGQVLPGFYADFLVLKDDPLKDPLTLKKPLRIFKGGLEIKIKQ